VNDPLDEPDRELTSGGDFSNTGGGNGPVHYGNQQLPFIAREEGAIDNTGSTNHVFTVTVRGGGNQASYKLVLNAGLSVKLSGRGIIGVTIDNADNLVIWRKGPRGSVFAIANPSQAGGASTVVHDFAGTVITPNANATFQQGGLGAQLAITPQKTGTVKVTVNVVLTASTTAHSVQVKGSSGTGSAPAQGAAATGTATDLIGQLLPTGASCVWAGPVTFVVSGLALGTAVWFDLQLSVTADATDSVVANLASAEELPT